MQNVVDGPVPRGGGLVGWVRSSGLCVVVIGISVNIYASKLFSRSQKYTSRLFKTSNTIVLPAHSLPKLTEFTSYTV